MATNLILALDVEDRGRAETVLKEIGPDLRTVKIGLQLFTRYGPEIVSAVHDLGFEIFLDLKLHDIPNTVAKAVASLSSLPISLLTIHTGGGGEMMAAAVRARNDNAPDLTLLGVTVLTSMDRAGLSEIGIESDPAVQVLRLSRLATASGVHGLVCSPLELPLLRKELGPDPVLVTPGIRPSDSASHEQKRIMTPHDAAAAGATHIVVGRPILEAPDRRAAVRSILADLS